MLTRECSDRNVSNDGQLEKQDLKHRFIVQRKRRVPTQGPKGNHHYEKKIKYMQIELRLCIPDSA